MPHIYLIIKRNLFPSLNISSVYESICSNKTNKKQLIYCLSVITLFFSCNKETVVNLSSLKELKTFTFTKDKNSNLDKDYIATIDNINKSVTVTLPAGTGVNNLIATFELSTASKVDVNGETQVSNITSNNFEDIVIYTVVAEDDSSIDYSVEVIIHVPKFIETSTEATQRTKIKNIYTELMTFYDGNSNNVISGANNQYNTIPNFTEDGSGNRTYILGEYKPEFKNYMLKWWEFFKTVAQRPDPYYKELDNERAEKAAFVLSSLKQITHYPSRPQDMGDDIYLSGRTGAERSNLFTAGDLYWFHETVQFNFTEGKVKDDLGSEINIPGINYMAHRWNGLWKNAASAGIGYNYFNNYTSATYYVVSNENNNSGFQGFSAFPHGYFPLQAQMKVKNRRSASDLFDKRYPEGFASDNTFGNGYNTIWTIQQFADHTFNIGKPVTVTIRDIDETGAIIDQINCNVDTEVKNDNGSFLRIKKTAFAGGWTFTIKPKDGILSNAVKEVLNSNKKKVFHITIAGEGLQPNLGKPDTISYRIIYYDLDYQ
jgi:hypothetical protein